MKQSLRPAHLLISKLVKKIFLVCLLFSFTKVRSEPVHFPGFYFSPSAVNLSADINPSCQSATVTFTANITPNTATGTVEFFDGAISLGNITISGGIATVAISSLTAGSHSLTAVYSGDINFDPSTSNTLSQVIEAGIAATPVSISGIANQCPSLVEQIYTVSPVSGADAYNWTVPAGWLITNGSGTETISVTTGTNGQNGNITVTSVNACGVSAPASLAVTVGNAAPATPGTIAGTATVCAGTSQVYNISAVTNATGYSWSVPAGWLITAGAGTTAITVTVASPGGNVTVTANNSCGNSAAQTKSIVVNSIPATPAAITGTATVCPSVTGLVYSIAPVSGATGYTWVLPVGWVVNTGAGTLSISATSGANSGNITVAATNACGSSATPQTVVITPANTTDNTGYTDGSTKSSDLIVTSTTTTPIRRGYLKFSLLSIPAGVTITASSLKFTNNGTVGSSGSANQVRGLGIVDPVTAPAATIFANAVSGTLYNNNTWPNLGQISLTLLAAANTDITNSISSPGYISMGLVRGAGANIYNFYGYSSGANVPLLGVTYASLRSLAVTVNPATPAAPTAITGSNAVCPNSTGNIYSITAVTNATTYNWAVPTGWNITSGQGTLSITVTGGNVGQNGNISVTAGNSCGTSAPFTQAVTVSVLPTVAVTPSAQSICSGQAIGTITISNPNAITGTTFTWTRDNSVVVTGIAATGTSAVITGNLSNALGTAQSTNFTITATANGCTSAAAVTATVTVNPNPTANAGVDQQICTAAFTPIGGFPTASGGTAGYTYAWTAGVSNTAIANPAAPVGTYTVTVTDSKGCTGADAVTITNGSSVKTWIGNGTSGTGPDNNFNNPLNWSPAGVPGSCNDVVMNVDVSNILNLFSGNLTNSLTADATVKSFSLGVGGTIILSTNTSFKLDVGTHAFTVLNNTLVNTNASTVLANPAKTFISVGAGGVLTYAGNLVTTSSNGNTNYPFYASVNNTGKMYVNANADLGGIANDAANKPTQIIFNGTGTQTITHNSGTEVIYLGATSTDIGETNSPVVVLAGPGINGFRSIGNLNINNTATLDIGTTQSLNRNAAGGTINMSAGSFMKLGRTTGGVGSSNFPSNFSSFVFNATSTVEYNAAGNQTVVTAPAYGNLTLSSSGFKTAAANLTAQKNITIQGTAILMDGANTITLGGNWTNYAQSGFSEQTSTVDFNGTTAQTINTTGGEIFYTLNKTAAGTTTMLSDVSVQGGGTSSFTLSAGTFDAGVYSFNSAASTFNISNGLLKLARTGVILLPEFAVTNYNLTGGTIELYGTGDQVLRGARAYRNLSFSTSGIKTLSSAITSVTGTILTQNSVILDVSNNTMGGAGTNLTMTGTSLYKTAGTATKPDAAGIYSLGVGTTVEFTSTAAGTTEDIRLTAPTYYNLVVSGTNVANPSAGTGIKLQTGGTFTVKNGGLFKLGSNAGFSGTAVTSIANTNNPSIVLEDGSTVEYYGGILGTNPQIITNVIPYYSLSFSGTSIKTAPAGIVTVKGNLSNSASGFLHNNGSFLLNGTSAQNYNSTGTTLSYYNFTVSNPVNINVNNDLNIENLFSLATTGKLNMAGGNIALKSGPLKTAAVDKIAVANSIAYTGAGRFIVERYIPTGATHGKTWQFLATPAFGASLNATWQEANAPLVTGATGLGTTITSEKAGAVGRGYDFYTAAGGPSIKTYNSTTNLWEGIDDGTTPTTSLSLNNRKGYMIFIRGDRSVQTSATPANITTLRTSGKLFSPGTDAPVSSAVSANKLVSVGNPYASAIDFLSVAATSTGIDSKYYVWDPLLPGSNGLGYGGYQLLSSANLWLPVPGGTLNYPTGTAYTKIQSGQAFFAYSTAGGTVNFNENNKLIGSQMVYRQQVNRERQFLRTYLYGTTGFIADGNVVAFDDAFSNGFEANDAIKLQNTTENFGILKNDKTLTLDARKPLGENDTIFYTMNNMRAQEYRLMIVPDGITNAGQAFFIDKFTGTKTPVSLSDSTLINFHITNDTASFSANRFYIIFKIARAIPVSINLHADRKTDGTISIGWAAQFEANVQRYELEKSQTGTDFLNLHTTSSIINNGAIAYYQYSDQEQVKTDHFYRIKAISSNGALEYSNTVKIPALKINTRIRVYPNPVTDKIIHLSFNGEQPGDYGWQLINASGQTVTRGSLVMNDSNRIKLLPLPGNTSAGTYQLIIMFSLTGKKYVQEIIIK